MLSAAAPFKVGGRKNDPASFVEVEKAELTFRWRCRLYLYPEYAGGGESQRQGKSGWNVSAGRFVKLIFTATNTNLVDQLQG